MEQNHNCVWRVCIHKHSFPEDDEIKQMVEATNNLYTISIIREGKFWAQPRDHRLYKKKTKNRGK